MPHTLTKPKGKVALHPVPLSQSSPAISREAPNSLSILVVDDEPTIRLSLRVAMQKEGFRVIEAGDGMECLRLFEQERPDIVLLDAMMPEMDGFSCCAALRNLSDTLLPTPEEKMPAPILMITALDDSQSVEQAFTAGASDYVTKPIHWALLRHRVRGLRDSIKRQQAEARIKQSLREKEALLKEVHHRVKNNLQIISSLLSLQSNSIEDDNISGLFRESQNRVRLMAMVHEKLYRSNDFGTIELAAYVRDLSNYLLRSYGINQNHVRLDIRIDQISLEIDSAVSCGLIINELITNSLKYAFPAASSSQEYQGEIIITAKLTSSNSFSILYQDSGTGLPEDLEIENTKTLGLQLISTLTEQLGGTLSVKKAKPTEFRFNNLLLSS
ncbi:MAG: histidine kinase dimerization/phosphoacceptor domain -containing protein [Cyanobacteria bacterium P01_D01_bin.1]